MGSVVVLDSFRIHVNIVAEKGDSGANKLDRKREQVNITALRLRQKERKRRDYDDTNGAGLPRLSLRYAPKFLAFVLEGV